jgi:hypothetical protein
MWLGGGFEEVPVVVNARGPRSVIALGYDVKNLLPKRHHTNTRAPTDAIQFSVLDHLRSECLRVSHPARVTCCNQHVLISARVLKKETKAI